MLPFAPLEKSGESVVAAGDISCTELYEERGRCQGPAVFSALKDYGGEIIALGDLLQMSKAKKKNYLDNFLRTWPVDPGKLRPVPGNHDYIITRKVRNKKGYQSFLSSVGLGELSGNYSWTRGDWRFFAIDSNCGWINCTLDSYQLTWLARKFARSDEKCFALYMHHPLFFPRGEKSVKKSYGLKNIWKLSELFGVSFILNGHMHYYERSKKVDHDGKADASGIRQFTVGTGGFPLANPKKHPLQEKIVREFGFLEIYLEADYYRWSFNDIHKESLDSGQDVCNSREKKKAEQKRYIANLKNKKVLADILADL